MRLDRVRRLLARAEMGQLLHQGPLLAGAGTSLLAQLCCVPLII
jgi:hypothetical protein